MTRQLVISREYKVMLRAERFAGSEREARRAVDGFWSDAGAVLEDIDIPTQGAFEEVKARRRIRFLDTAQGGLNGARYIFRERVDVDDDSRQVTLKFRHADRYVAQDRDMGASGDPDDAATKFEEDVKPPFTSVFSFSTTVKVGHDRRFERVDDVADLFPGVRDELRGVDRDDHLGAVRGFCARELVLVGGAVLLGRRDVEAGCAMVFWHDDDATTPPVCVEFSFKYGDDEEDYRGSVARDAHDVLAALHGSLPDWVDPDPRTKTVFVYQ